MPACLFTVVQYTNVLHLIIMIDNVVSLHLKEKKECETCLCVHMSTCIYPICIQMLIINQLDIMATNCLNSLIILSKVFLSELLMNGIVYHVMSYSYQCRCF